VSIFGLAIARVESESTVGVRSWFGLEFGVAQRPGRLKK
jgi:hypothetical protein